MSRNSGFSGIISGAESRLEWAEEPMNWKQKNERLLAKDWRGGNKKKKSPAHLKARWK